MDIKQIETKIKQAIADLLEGKPIVLYDRYGRENEGDLVALASRCTPELVNLMIGQAKGLICVPMSQKRAEKLHLNPMVARNQDVHQTAFTVSVDEKNCKTGISAQERCQTIVALADENTQADQFHKPGHIFPLIAHQQGLAVRQGHTEAACALARWAGQVEVGVICEILDDQGYAMSFDNLKVFAEKNQFVFLVIDELVWYYQLFQMKMTWQSQAMIPTKHGAFLTYAYRSMADQKEHLALVKQFTGIPSVRIHSSCCTGDVFSSQLCDCGEQLHFSLEYIQKHGGVVIYLNQEGRGIGLVNKIKAYTLQSQGMDTLQANVALGFAADERDYFSAVHILKDLGIAQCYLLTNNPDKVQFLTDCQIQVQDIIPVQVGSNLYNQNYLKTKKEKMGHWL